MSPARSSHCWVANAVEEAVPKEPMGMRSAGSSIRSFSRTIHDRVQGAREFQSAAGSIDRAQGDVHSVGQVIATVLLLGGDHLLAKTSEDHRR
jgi:hypothetical protein